MHSEVRQTHFAPVAQGHVSNYMRLTCADATMGHARKHRAEGFYGF